MKLFTKRCNHMWVKSYKSNAIQQDEMGYPLRLYVYKCVRCGISEQRWVDVDERELEELKTGESVLITWRKI